MFQKCLIEGWSPSRSTMNEETVIIIDDKCPFCGAPIKGSSSSFHVWEDVFECGLVVRGAIDDDSGEGIIEAQCNNKPA